MILCFLSGYLVSLSRDVILFIYLFIYLFMAVLGLRFCARAFLVAASGGHSSSRCADLSLSWPLLLRSTGSRCAGSIIVAHGPSCSAACGILPDQGLNPCPLHWQADSQPLRHQGSPNLFFIAVLRHAIERLLYEIPCVCTWIILLFKFSQVSFSHIGFSLVKQHCRS